MTIKTLRPQVMYPPPREQCQVILPDDPCWSMTREQAFGPKSKAKSLRGKPEKWDHQQCQRYADYELDGMHLCRGHAARKCLHDRLGEPFPFAVRTPAG